MERILIDVNSHAKGEHRMYRQLLSGRLSITALLLHPRPRRLMGVNFGLPREVFHRANGLNERWIVYGREDYDLELRLKRAGFEFYGLVNRGIVYHVFHEECERSEEALALTAAQEASDRVRCEIVVEAR